MATKAASKRLSKEYVIMQREPPPFVWAVPDEKNILRWNYIIRGPPDSLFAGGEYHGLLLFPSEYPFKPPGIKILTPSGRFRPDKKICFSMSDFHPGSWNPAWISFMLSDDITTGSVTSSDTDKRTYAQQSHGWNITQARFKEAFPEYCTLQPRDLPNMGEWEQGIIKAPVTLFPLAPQQAVPLQTIAKPSTPLPTFAVTPTAPKVLANSVPCCSTGKADKAANSVGWVNEWSQLLWQKWCWGVLIALAVIVSKISSKD
ncbi:UBC-like protein [Armillaria gallica]|uniref:UBC-like protein n=1 Tax=Armillaria gallica TaxID=47427 RepID=A0A2H3CJF9_ARMGA|nr:UBC-like protein [Armillaria gallica]